MVLSRQPTWLPVWLAAKTFANVALSMGIGLIFLPLIIWLGMKSGIGTIMAIILGLIIALKSLPTARAAWTKTETKKDFVFDQWQKNKTE